MISLGYVCSFDALPLMASAGRSQEERWRGSPCASYGSIIRQMRAGRLAGGLLPLDIFAIEFLSAHAPVQSWRILTLQAARPREFVISNAARHLLKPTQQSSTLPFRIALDGLNSVTQRTVEAWVKQHLPHIQSRATYRVLPINTVHQGMETAMIEAFAAPSPWGLMAQHQEVGTLQTGFQSSGPGDNVMALVVHSQHAVDDPGAMQRIQTALAQSHKELCTPQGRAMAIDLLSAPSPCGFPPAVLREALDGTPPSALPAPASIARIASSLSRLVEGGAWRGNALSNARLAQALSVF